MNKIITYLLFPVFLLLGIVGSAVALHLGAPPSTIPIAATLVSLFMVLLVERLMPRVRRASENGELRADLGFATMTTIVDTLLQSGIATLMVLIAMVLPTDTLSEVSLLVGVPLALLVIGFGDYWAHRFGHEWGWWWKLHSVHHAPHRMVALNNFRIHPIDLALKLIFAMVSTLLLGFSLETLAMAGALKGLNIAFQHANIDLRHGVLNYIVATNSVHRWHHSAKASEADANYGGVLVLYDLLFRSYRVPEEHLDPEQMGLFEEGHYPIHEILRSSVAPFCWHGCVETKR